MTTITECVTGDLMMLGEELHVGDPNGGGAAAAMGEEEGSFLCFCCWIVFGWTSYWGVGWEGDEEF